MEPAFKTTNFDPHALAREQLKHIYVYRNRVFLLRAITGLVAAGVLLVQLNAASSLAWYAWLMASGAWHWHLGRASWQDVGLWANHFNIHRHITAACISGLGWGALAVTLLWLPRSGQDAMLVLMVIAISTSMPRLVVLPPFFVAFAGGVLVPLVLMLPFLDAGMRYVVVLMLFVATAALWFSGKEMRRALVDILLKQISFENASWEDRLTGLANRRRFDERLAESWHQAIRLQVPLSLILLDVDHFKRFNDCYGHQAGDTCLQRVAGALASRIRRAGDLLARYGGEEFAIVLFHTSMNDGRSVSESVRQAVADMQLKHEESPMGIVTVSLGGATIVPSKEARMEDLVRSADEALYRAKGLGRNRVEWNMM